MIGGEVRQVERETGADDDRIGAARAGLPDVIGVAGHRTHHVDCEHAAAFGQRARTRDFAVERDQVRAVDRGPVATVLRFAHEVGMVPAEIDRRDRADGAVAGDRSREPVCGYADAHAALHDRQQLAATNDQRGER